MTTATQLIYLKPIIFEMAYSSQSIISTCNYLGKEDSSEGDPNFEITEARSHCELDRGLPRRRQDLSGF